MDKYKLQERQYDFPYHHIPYVNKEGDVVRFRYLHWGFKYFCYLLHIKELIESLKPDSVLDVGCGDGKLLGSLSSRIDRKVGVDLSRKPITFAKAFYPEIDFLVKDASDLEEIFDVVVAMEVLEHIPDDEVSKFLNACADRVKSGGHMVISVPTIVIPLNKKHYRHYDIDLFKSQLMESKADLEIVDTNYIFKETFLLKVYKKITHNSRWLIEFKFLNKFVWRYIWKKLRITNSKYGQDMVVVMRKK